MKFFRERPLAAALVALVGGFSLFASFPLLLKLLSLGLSLILLCMAFIRPLREMRGRLILFATLLAAGILLSALYFDLYMPISARYGGEHIVTASVVDIDEKDADRVLSLRTSRIDGDRTRRLLRADLYRSEKDLGYDVSDLAVGDTVVCRTRISSFGESASGFDFNDYYMTQGYSASADILAFVSVEHGDRIPIAVRIRQYRSSLCDLLQERAGVEAGGFLSAVLLGERERMSSSMILDFRRIGIAHVLALSGMHLAILAGFLEKILARLRVNKKIRRGLLAVFAVVFMALTGFSPSVCRAGIMLILSCLLFLLGAGQDPFTSLAIAAAVILAASPYAAKDVGLWLSVFACFGMIFGADLMQKEKIEAERAAADARFRPKTGLPAILSAVWRPIRSSLIFSSLAVMATSVFTVTTFGSVSVASPLTTPVFALLIEAYLLLGTLILLLGRILPIGKLLPFLYRPIRDFAALLSDIPGIYVSARAALTATIGFAALILLIFAFLFGVKRPKRVIPLFMLLTLAFLCSAYFTTAARKSQEHLVYATDRTNECFLITSGGKTAVVDCSGPSSPASYFSVGALVNEGLAECDVYVFTSYSGLTDSAVQTLLSRIAVRNLCLPFPKNTAEVELSAKVLHIANEHRSEITFYKQEERLGLSSFSLVQSYRDAYKSGKKNLLVLMYGNEVCTYFSAGTFEGDTKTVAEKLLTVSDTAVFGCHGTKYEYYHKLSCEGERLRRAIVEDEHIALDEDLIRRCFAEYYPTRSVIR